VKSRPGFVTVDTKSVQDLIRHQLNLMAPGVGDKRSPEKVYQVVNNSDRESITPWNLPVKHNVLCNVRVATVILCVN